MSTPTRWRAGDADRERVADALRTAHADGRLGLDEFGERLDAAFAAIYVDELGPLTADLPPDDDAVVVVQHAGRARPDPRWQGRRGAWSGVNPTWSGLNPAWAGRHAAWLHGPGVGPTSYGTSPSSSGGWPVAHACSGRAGFPGRWVGLFVLVAVLLAVVAVAGGSAPWPLLLLAIAFVALSRRPRSGLRRSS